MNFVKAAVDLYEEFKTTDDTTDRYDFPFPFAVFGTLRSFPRCQGNSHRMYFGGVKPIAHCKAFLPHTSPYSIWLEYKAGHAGVFELYFYSPEDWKKIIPGVDSLEGFRKQSRRHGYLRTLMELRLLPEGDYPAFDCGIGRDSRSLEIKEKDFENYTMVPAWVYSNRETNDSIMSLGNRSSVLWDHFAGEEQYE